MSTFLYLFFFFDITHTCVHFVFTLQESHLILCLRNTKPFVEQCSRTTIRKSGFGPPRGIPVILFSRIHYHFYSFFLSSHLLFFFRFYTLFLSFFSVLSKVKIYCMDIIQGKKSMINFIL